jgi:polyhydroxybutyrate depolymerase
MKRRCFLIALWWLSTAGFLGAQNRLMEALLGRPPEGYINREWTVDGEKRTALLRIPKELKESVPVVFCWHGHGGNASHSVHSWGYDKVDTRSILIFPQGLNTPTPLVDKDGRFPGWQTAVGEQGDRDLHFFDAMLVDLKKEQKVDARRIYSMGHSNGAVFSYVLWEARPDILAAIGPVAGCMTPKMHDFKPLPVIHIAGKKDPLVKYVWQDATFTAVRQVNGCALEGTEWAKEGVLVASLYPSTRGAPLVTALHAGGHEFPQESVVLIDRFFKENPKPVK